MFAVRERFQCGGKEYILLLKKNIPWMVEFPNLEDELQQGAERYPKAQDVSEEGWISIPDRHFQTLEEEGCLEKCLLEEMEEQSVFSSPVP